MPGTRETTVRDRDGNVVETSTVPVDDRTINNHTLQNKIDAGLSVIEGHVTDWDSYSNAQKAEASRDALRGVAFLARLARGALDDPGPA